MVCLGTTGRNVAAGMTGGLAYFYDEEGDVDTKVRPLTPVTAQHVKDHVKGLQVVSEASKAWLRQHTSCELARNPRQGLHFVSVRLPVQVNGEIVSIQRVCTPAGEQQLKKLIQDHVDLTGSKKGAAILKDWSASLQKFWQLVPPSGVDPPVPFTSYSVHAHRQCPSQGLHRLETHAQCTVHMGPR